MLSDVCFETLREIWDSGAPDLGKLRREILNYTIKPYDYPKSITDVLLAAVNETSKSEANDRDALLEPIGLMSLLICTMRSYDSFGASQADLLQELFRLWPRATQAVARLPPPTEDELRALR